VTPADAAHRVEGASALATRVLHHRLALRDTLARLAAAPLATGLVALTLGVALALPALLATGVAALDALVRDWDAEVRVNLFVESPTERSRDALLQALRENRSVASVSWQSPEASLAEFVGAMGFEDGGAGALAALGEDPLPAVAVVSPAASDRAPARLRGLAARLERLPGVVGVQVDLEWVERLDATLRTVGRLAAGLGALLGLGVLLAVGGLTRARLDARRQEIVVLRLIGATDAFVRRPFLYEGVLQGVLGGFAAVLLVELLLAVLAGPLGTLAASYGLATVPGAPLGSLLLSLPGTGALLGWIGARAALARRLGAIEP
jgi:cell division transport system permease protein